MSTEKNQNQEIKIETNVLKFPNQKENEQLKKQREEHAVVIQTIAQKMDQPNFDQLPLTYVEVLFLSNHGETIEFPKHISARLVSVLATQLNKNSFMEDLL
jgi:hypothetical protein